MQNIVSSGRRRQRSRVQGGWAVGQSGQFPLKPQQRSHSGMTNQIVNTESTDTRNIYPAKSVTPCGASQGNVAAHPPRNFTWVEEGLLCAMAFPDRPQHIQYLVEHNVHYIVNLTYDLSPRMEGFKNVEVIRMGIEDFTPPSFEQVHHFVSIVKEAYLQKMAVAVHCRMGQGRTGTLLACFLVAYHNMSAPEAIAHIQRVRPISFQTSDQENFVHLFEKQCLCKETS